MTKEEMQALRQWQRAVDRIMARVQAVRPDAPIAAGDSSPAGDPQSVSAPTHYIAPNGMEAIDVIDAFKLRFYRGNAVKYLLRAARKGRPLEDLRKAKWYINRVVELVAAGEDIDNV